MKREFQYPSRDGVTQISCNRMGAGGGDPCGYAVMSWYGRIYRPI